MKILTDTWMCVLRMYEQSTSFYHTQAFACACVIYNIHMYIMHGATVCLRVVECGKTVMNVVNNAPEYHLSITDTGYVCSFIGCVALVFWQLLRRCVVIISHTITVPNDECVVKTTHTLRSLCSFRMRTWITIQTWNQILRRWFGKICCKRQYRQRKTHWRK